MDALNPSLQKPLNHLLVKPAGPDCNMSCQYCFYRRKKDFFPQTKIHRMDETVLERMIRELMEQGPKEVSISWQGGEPTLMGLAFFRKAIELEKRYGQGKIVANGLQTNGLLIDRDWTAFLQQYHFLVGLSLDGPDAIHDHYRRGEGGQVSACQVREAAGRLLDAGVAVNALCVVNDFSVRFPEEIYCFFKSLGLIYMQFIPCVEGDPGLRLPTVFSVPPLAYGAFLCRLFDLWIADFSDDRPTTSIRFFESLLFSYAGLSPPECTLLPECGTYLVIEHNGEVFSCDFFVAPEHRLGIIGERPLKDLLNSPKQQSFGHIKSRLPEECLLCRWLTFCRGGCLKDRFSGQDMTGLNYFCRAYKEFFPYADNRFKKLIADRRKKEQGLNLSVKTRAKKIGRNVPCPCGSGRKFKKCCALHSDGITNR
jgi:uncharacterized protein